MKKIARSKRNKYTGRAPGPTFLRLPHEMLHSRQFGALSPIACKLLLEIGRQYRGNNNGDLSVAFLSLRSRGWGHPDTIRKARNELEEAGFIETSRPGGGHICTLVAMTWEAVDDIPDKGVVLMPTTTEKDTWKKKEPRIRPPRKKTDSPTHKLGRSRPKRPKH
jgi:hypothetical protein